MEPEKRKVFGKIKIKNKILENLKKEKRRYNYSKRCIECGKVYVANAAQVKECGRCRSLTRALNKKFQNKKIELSGHGTPIAPKLKQ